MLRGRIICPLGDNHLVPSGANNLHPEGSKFLYPTVTVRFEEGDGYIGVAKRLRLVTF
ncbi:protein of unknown function [Agreia sp. COWG]|nr:protein of unknown function [Agreia sp. COWG]